MTFDPHNSSGLSEQLLSIVVAQERPDLEEVRGQLIISRAQMGVQLAEMQSDILYGLSNSEGSPVDDLQLITTLEAIKLKSVEIMVRELCCCAIMVVTGVDSYTLAIYDMKTIR